MQRTQRCINQFTQCPLHITKNIFQESLAQIKLQLDTNQVTLIFNLYQT